MNAEQVIDLARDSVWVMIVAGAPMMVVALVVGVAVSLVQALTQVQEMTLTFVPKLVAMLVTFVLTAPLVLATLREYALRLMGQIVAIGGSG